jgi:hypothetical protein
MAAAREHRTAPKSFNEQIAILKSQAGAVVRLMFHPTEDYLVLFYYHHQHCCVVIDFCKNKIDCGG